MPKKTDTTHHADQRNLSFWPPTNQLEQLDNHLANRCRGLVGVKPSRQAWLQDLVSRELAKLAAQIPVAP